MTDYRTEEEKQRHKSYTKNISSEPDLIVKEVLEKYIRRSEAGMKTYGVPMTREDLTTEQWLVHLQEELMDATLYVTRILKDVQKIKGLKRIDTGVTPRVDGDCEVPQLHQLVIKEKK